MGGWFYVHKKRVGNDKSWDGHIVNGNDLNDKQFA